jgi:hypothetical protein
MYYVLVKKKKRGLDKSGKNQYTDSSKAKVVEGHIGGLGAQYLLLIIRP